MGYIKTLITRKSFNEEFTEQLRYLPPILFCYVALDSKGLIYFTLNAQVIYFFNRQTREIKECFRFMPNRVLENTRKPYGEVGVIGDLQITSTDKLFFSELPSLTIYSYIIHSSIHRREYELLSFIDDTPNLHTNRNFFNFNEANKSILLNYGLRTHIYDTGTKSCYPRESNMWRYADCRLIFDTWSVNKMKYYTTDFQGNTYFVKTNDYDATFYEIICTPLDRERDQTILMTSSKFHSKKRLSIPFFYNPGPIIFDNKRRFLYVSFQGGKVLYRLKIDNCETIQIGCIFVAQSLLNGMDNPPRYIEQTEYNYIGTISELVVDERTGNLIVCDGERNCISEMVFAPLRLQEDFRFLFKSKMKSDITVLVGGMYYCLHRTLLETRCPCLNIF